MKLYIDESGSITSSKHNKNRFFVICFVHTDNPSKLIREFRKAKVKFAEAHTHKQVDNKNTALLNICNRGFYDYFPQKHKENDFFYLTNPSVKAYNTDEVRL